MTKQVFVAVLAIMVIVGFVNVETTRFWSEKTINSIGSGRSDEDIADGIQYIFHIFRHWNTDPIEDLAEETAPRLVELLTHENRTISQMSAIALKEASKKKPGSVYKSGVSDALIELLSSENVMVRVNAAYILASIAHSNANDLIGQGIIEALIKATENLEESLTERWLMIGIPPLVMNLFQSEMSVDRGRLEQLVLMLRNFMSNAKKNSLIVGPSLNGIKCLIKQESMKQFYDEELVALIYSLVDSNIVVVENAKKVLESLVRPESSQQA